MFKETVQKKNYSKINIESTYVLNMTWIFWPIPDVPTPPSGIHVSDIYKDSCVLSWSPSTSDGGSPITGYHIEQRLVSRPMWLPVSSHPVSGVSYRPTGLMEGQSYQYRVIAENRVGRSEPSALSATVLAKDPWDKPAAPGSPTVEKWFIVKRYSYVYLL